jgi:hypothetical protein
MTAKIQTFILAFLLAVAPIWGQDNKPLAIFAGIGSHEAIHAGFRYNYLPNLSAGAAIGSFFNLIKDEKYWAVTLSNEWRLPSKNNKEMPSTWSFNQKLFYWQMKDQRYLCKTLSIQPTLGKIIYLNPNNYLNCEIGPVFMVVLDYKRLTFEHVGWPKKLLLNACITYNFKL